MKRKTILIILCVGLLVAISMMGTLAYLTDTDSAVNTFTVGHVDISLDEADVDENGVPIEGADRVQGNEYHLIPGQTYTKDPTVTVKGGSEASYVRMMVTLNNATQLKAIFGENFLPENYVTGWYSNTWPCCGITEDKQADTITYEFRYYEIAQPGVLPALFTGITVPGSVSGEELEKLQNLTIAVEGHAIQAAGFETADAAWESFAQQVK